MIGQQWAFTYRYPTFGGFETTDLVIPANTWIAFHVTSLDVVHSFWAYQLGVKADANPGYDNVAYTKTTDQLGNFTVRCAELCGIWHGAMFDTGRVESVPAFMAWATATEARPGPGHQAAAPVRVDVHTRRERGRWRLLPRQPGPLQPGRDVRSAEGDAVTHRSRAAGAGQSARDLEEDGNMSIDSSPREAGDRGG